MNKKIIISDSNVTEVGDVIIIQGTKIIDLNVMIDKKDSDLRSNHTLWTNTGREVYLSNDYDWVIGKDELGYTRLYAVEK